MRGEAPEPIAVVGLERGYEQQVEHDRGVLHHFLTTVVGGPGRGPGPAGVKKGLLNGQATCKLVFSYISSFLFKILRKFLKVRENLSRIGPLPRWLQ